MVVKEDEADKAEEPKRGAGKMAGDEKVVKEDEAVKKKETNDEARKMVEDEMVMKEDEPVINEQVDRYIKGSEKVDKIEHDKESNDTTKMVNKNGLVEAAEEITTDGYNNGEN